MWLRHKQHPRDYLSISVKDGVWNVNSFTSTGVKESYVENILGGSDANNLGNGETSNGYAIAGGATRS